MYLLLTLNDTKRNGLYNRHELLCAYQDSFEILIIIILIDTQEKKDRYIIVIFKLLGFLLLF